MGGIGVFLASALVGTLTTNLSPAAMGWGWRVPSSQAPLGVVALIIRVQCQTPLFQALQRKGETLRSPLRESRGGSRERT